MLSRGIMMKILEARDGFVKIEADNKIEISSFLEIKGAEKRFIAQVIRSKNNGAGYTAYAKILFVYDGTLKKYDKTLPDVSANVTEFPFDLINNSFNYYNPVVVGKFVSDGTNILLDSNCFNNSALFSIDSQEVNNILVQNITKQFKQKGKVVLIDMLGVINGDSYVAGRDFKLPLNTESLKFMYEDCLNDATSDSKNMIKEIFADLAEYSKEVKFLPFNTLKSIVDDMVENSHIFKLLVFKNKLAKFEKAGYFASAPADADNLSKILESDFVIIDLSKLDGLFQNRYLSVILSEIGAQKDKITVFLEASNAINKKNIKSLLYSDNMSSTLVTHSKFKYLADLKPMFKNYFIENTPANNEIFKLYSFFLESMKPNNYLIVGEGSNYVPIISKVEKYDVEVRKLPQDSASEEVIDTVYDSQIPNNCNVSLPNDTGETEFADANSSEDYEQYVTKINESESSDIIEELPSEADNALSEFVESSDEAEPEADNPTQEDSIDEFEEINQLDNIESDVFISDTDIEASDEQIDEPNDENDLEDENTTDDVLLQVEGEDIQEFKDEESDTSEEDNEENLSDENIEIPADLVGDIDQIEEEANSDIQNVDVDEENTDELAFAEPEILPIDDSGIELGEFVELNPEELNDDEILVDLSDEEILPEESTSDENMTDFSENTEQSIMEDVDKVYTTMKDDSISDSDLDFIDTLNEFDMEETESELNENEYLSENDMETLETMDESEDEAGFLEPLEEISDSDKDTQEKEILEKRESSTPIVPVYDAEIPEEDKVISDEIEQGDSVVHVKYGSGIVEKMIKYGNKNLYSINFDNVGRRLLDPTLTEIKKA